MIIEISVAIIALCFVVVVPYLVVTLLKTQKALESAKRDLHRVSTEAVELIERLDRLTNDLKSKSESLNFVFRPLKGFNKSHKESGDTMTEVVDWITTSLSLYDKLKAVVKHYAK